MTIHYYLERKQLKSQEKAIYCYIRGIEKGKTIILNTGQKVDPIYWDKQRELANGKGKNRYTGATELNDFLDSYREEIKRTIRLHVTDNPDGGFDNIKLRLLERFGKSQKLTLSFFEALDLFTETRSKDLSPNSLRKFTTIKGHLKAFEKKEHLPLTFSKIDLLFYDKFLRFLLEEKEMVNNSAYKIIGLLKIFLNWAYDRGISTNQTFKKFKVKEDKVDIIALNEEELKKLTELDLSSNTRLSRARDLFLFGCYTGGRFSDLAKIEWTDIRDNTWFLWVQKNKNFLKVPLIDLSLAILEKYKEEEHPIPRLSNQKLNVYIKEICELAKINDLTTIVHYSGSNRIEKTRPKFELVTTHSARRTFITQSIIRGMKAEIVMAISGHKNYRTFQKYLDITNKDREVELKKAWESRM